MIEPITIDNFGKINIKELSLNKDKFGPLVFDVSYKKLLKLQDLFKELDDLDYKNNLTPRECNKIDLSKKQFAEHLNWLNNFDIQKNSNPKNEHDGFDTRIDSFHDSVFGDIRPYLSWLRQEFSSKNIDLEELKKQQKSAIQAEKAYKELSSKLEAELNILKEKKIEVESKHGEIAATTLSLQFGKQTKENSENAKGWLLIRNILYYLLIFIIVLNLLAYFFIFFAHRFGYIALSTKEIFTIEYLIIKIALISVLSYGIAFASKNYNIQSNLSTVNQHRRNVAQTLEDFFSTKPDRKSEMLKEGTEAMFKHLPVGYLSKNETKENGPLLETINNFFKSKD